jgi:hypothetical protein
MSGSSRPGRSGQGGAKNPAIIHALHLPFPQLRSSSKRVPVLSGPERVPQRRARPLICLLVFLTCSAAIRTPAADRIPFKSSSHLSKIDVDLLDDISRRSFRYFWEQTDPRTGLVLDRARTDGKEEDDPDHRNVASIAATGFGLTAYCIAADHRWISREVARERIRTALRFFANGAPGQHGWFYHFMDATTGKRRWKSEVSSIDTALLLAGILTARQAFKEDPEIERLATAIYDRVNFIWMTDRDQTVLRHGWKPETGFLPYWWDTYSEHVILYLLAIGSPTHPIPPVAWNSWRLPLEQFGGYTYIGGGPLFIQQYSQAWVDLRDYVPEESQEFDAVRPPVNYFANAVAATRAQQALGVELSRRFRGFSARVWGITASDSANGYIAWGDLPPDPRIDGTVVPSAAAGSLMFTPDISIPALRTMLLHYGKTIYGRYGFADAFNPTTGWVSKYVIGIDAGITLLSAENQRTGMVWRWFLENPEVNWALGLVGLVRNPASRVGCDANLGQEQKPRAPSQRNSASNYELLPQVQVATSDASATANGNPLTSITISGLP